MPYTNQQTWSGNLITVEVDNQLIGLIQSCRLTDNYGLEDASGVGDVHVVEHVPSKAVHTVSLSNMVLFKGNMRTVLGVLNENGDSVMKGLVFDIGIYARGAYGTGGPTTTPPAGAQLRAIIGCSYDSGDVDITAHRISMQSGQFKALDVRGLGI